MEVFTLARRRSRQALIDIALHERPCRIPANKVLIVADLIAQRIQLLVRLTGHTGIVGHPHGDIVYGSPSELLAHRMNVHGFSPLSFVLSLLYHDCSQRKTLIYWQGTQMLLSPAITPSGEREKSQIRSFLHVYLNAKSVRSVSLAIIISCKNPLTLIIFFGSKPSLS